MRLGWALLIVAFIACAVLGFWGFTLYQQQAGQVDPALSRIYLTVQLFVLQSGSLSGVLPWQLEVARVLAPVVAAYTAVLYLLGLFTEQVEAWKVRRQSGHVVVVGLQDTGAALCQNLLESGRRVVGVAPDLGSVPVDALRSMGGLVVAGDPRLPHTLRRAGIGRATNLAVCVGNDEATVEVVEAARQVARSGGRPVLQCVALLTDPHLWTQQVVAELADLGTEPIRTHFVNELSAGLLSGLSRHPQISPSRNRAAQRIVTGTGPVMANTVLALVRLWRGRGEGSKLPLLVLGAQEGQVQQLVQRYPEIGQWAVLRVAATAEEGLDRGRAHIGYVCDEDATAAAGHVLALTPRLGAGDHLVVVRRRRAAVTDLIARSAGRAGGPSLLTLSICDEVVRSGVLLNGTAELLARALHQMYVEDRLAEGVDPRDPALLPWDELAQTLRHSNRSQAGHIAAKLSALGRGIAPLTDWDGAAPVLRPDEVEALAELEHERWVTEREQQGWTPGPRNPNERTSPYLVPWTQLPEDVKELDRLFVRALPRVLAVAGLQLLPPHSESM